MKRFARIGMAVATLAGVAVMAAPTAFAAENAQGAQIGVAGFAQTQYGGTGANTMAQGGSLQVGNLQADSIGASLSASGEYSTYSTNTVNNLSSSTSGTSADNLNQSNYATDIAQQSAGVTLNQNMTFGDDSNGGASQTQLAIGGGVQGTNKFWNNLFETLAPRS